MALLSISNLHYAYGDRHVLAGVNLTLDHGEHVGMVGLNGCGKSTLMKLIAGLGNLKADTGQIQLARGATAGYLAQETRLDPDKTLREEAGSAFAHLDKLHHELDAVTHEMQHAEGDALDALLQKYEKLQAAVEAAGGYAVDHRIDATLHGLGLASQTFNVRVRDLSGGQKGRLALAKLLLTNPDLLLLDEPTNHLDIDGRIWLENYLREYPGAVIVISHDRWLLDRCVSKIYELSLGKMEEYPGNYAKYRQLRQERLEFRQREYDKQQDRIQKEQAFIDRYRAGQRASQAQGREKRLERYKRDEMLNAPVEFDTISLSFAAKTRPGDMVLGADHISKGYEGKQLFSEFSIVVRRGDRIGIIGPNGSGKTTLVSCMLEKMKPDSGTVRIGASVDLGYYHQTHGHLNPNETVVEYLRRVTASEQAARDIAGAFLFSGDAQDKPLGVLSGGERSRTVLAGLMSGGHNLLVLDEPTNHLDIPSAERLEEAMAVYVSEPKSFGERTSGGGTLLLITHDRMLLDNTVNQLLIFDGAGNVRHFHGTYSDYLAATNAERADASAGAAVAVNRTPRKPEKRQDKPKQAAKPQAAGAKKPSGAFAQMSQSKLEQQITQIEKRLAVIDTELADQATYRDGDRVKKLQSERQKLATELAPLEEEWLRRSG